MLGLWFAHVDQLTPVISFNLNFGTTEPVLTVGDKVFATCDNGRTGQVYIINGVVESTFYPACKSCPWDFTSVDYTATPAN